MWRRGQHKRNCPIKPHAALPASKGLSGKRRIVSDNSASFRSRYSARSRCPNREGAGGFASDLFKQPVDIGRAAPEKLANLFQLPVRDVTMSLAGAQTKLAVAVFDRQIALPLHGAASTHILKLASERLFSAVENELLCMRLAARLELPVARTTMGTAGGLRYLLVERYDRHVAGNRLVQRGHQEDFCQALGYFPTEKYEARRGPGFVDLFDLIDRSSRRSARDRLNLLDLIIFACGIGDTDRHGKNFSLLITQRGVRLAPGYDLVSSLPYEGITRNLAMEIADKNRAEYLERRHWERFAHKMRLSPAATVKGVAQLATAMADQVGPMAKDLADEFQSNRDALRIFADQIAKQAATVAANSHRGPAAAESAEDF